MTGQCEFHPFESAIEVCGVCYGDICDICVTTVRSRRDVICRDCTVAMSGVRGSSKTEVRGDKSTVEARRAALHPSTDADDGNADGDDDTEWLREETPAPRRGRLSSLASGLFPGSGNPQTSATTADGADTQSTEAKMKSPEAAFAQNSAVNELARIRREGPSQVASNSAVDAGEAVRPQPTSPPAPEAMATSEGDASIPTNSTSADATPSTSDRDAAWPTLAPKSADGSRPRTTEQPGSPEEADEPHWSEVTAPDLNHDPFASR